MYFYQIKKNGLYKGIKSETCPSPSCPHPTQEHWSKDHIFIKAPDGETARIKAENLRATLEH